MIMRFYKKIYLGLPEEEMTAVDGIIDVMFLVLILLIFRAISNLVIV